MIHLGTIGPVNAPHTPYRVRRAPTQHRAGRQIERILDAASRVVTEKGLTATTTADIAKVAGVSIGSVYRYFPDKTAVLRAVLERNLLRYRERLEEVERASPPRDWREAVDTAYETYVEMCRTDIGFRAVSGAALAASDVRGAHGVADPLSPALAELLVERHGFADSPGLRTALLQCVAVADVLTRLAFRLDEVARLDTLAQTRRVVRELVGAHAPR